MKRIGIIDYFLDEYHAHVAPKNVDAVSKKLGYDFKIVAAYAERDADGGLTTDEFCEKYSVKRCGSIEELATLVDCFMILAPDNNEKKEGYALEAVKYGKPIFMDKTFTESYESAVRIFDAADKAGVPLFSSSSLRYASELQPYKTDCTSVLVTGSGVELEMYAVHYLEIVISCMGVGIGSVRHEMRGEQEWAHIEYSDGRHATFAISMGKYLGFRVFLTDRDGITDDIQIGSDIFALQMAAVLKFFKTGAADFDRAETLELMRVYDAIFESKGGNGKWVNLQKIN